jgi:hypothetical protein
MSIAQPAQEAGGHMDPCEAFRRTGHAVKSVRSECVTGASAVHIIYAACWVVVTGARRVPSHPYKWNGMLRVQCNARAVVFVHNVCGSSDTLRE